VFPTAFFPVRMFAPRYFPRNIPVVGGVVGPAYFTAGQIWLPGFTAGQTWLPGFTAGQVVQK